MCPNQFNKSAERLRLIVHFYPEETCSLKGKVRNEHKSLWDNFKNTQMDTTNMKRCSISLVIWEIQIRTLKKVMVFDLGVKDRLEEE